LVIAAVAWQSHKKIVIARSEATRQSSVASEARQSSVASEARQSQPYFSGVSLMFLNENKNIDIEQD